MFLVYTVFSSSKEAEKVVTVLLKEKLIACANIFPCNSFFFWKNRLCKERETVAIMKTSENSYEKLENRISELHFYKVPAILAIKLEKGEKKFVEWVNESCKIT